MLENKTLMASHNNKDVMPDCQEFIG